MRVSGNGSRSKLYFGLRVTFRKKFAEPGSRYFLIASRLISGWKYCAKCQVWPLVRCGLPSMLAEMTPMRYTLLAFGGGSALAFSAKAPVDARTSASRRREKTVSRVIAPWFSFKAGRREWHSHCPAFFLPSKRFRRMFDARRHSPRAAANRIRRDKWSPRSEKPDEG